MTIFKGSGVALVTPFQNDGVNYHSLRNLIDWHIDQGTDALIVCGTTGESATLSRQEKQSVISSAVEHAAGRIPVVAGTGGNNTAESAELSRFAADAGADALLLVTPYYNKATQNGLVTHFASIADSAGIPCILYNVPGRTGLNMKPETVARLAQHPLICGIKEASGDISQIARVARLCPGDFALYAGNDDQIVPTLSLGGVGVISVVANVLPRQTHELVHLYLDGMTREARELQLAMLPLIDALFCEVNPIPVKAALNLMGHQAGALRAPLSEIEADSQASLIRELHVWGLVNAE
ncbi:MAG TPA: 4-hydroxy-tetrahydrodipicolinate synthase [Bacillota bacterium]|nr:4-hydroxy-tetrahydrodipicolinate synthase [Bacillota bacterium]